MTRLHTRSPAPRAVAYWLLLVAAMVFLMVVVGGITRLTESGLSITEWKLVSGVLPPLTDAQWQQAFASYQQIPQYRAIHAEMTLDQFKTIYFWEYLHRLIGRTIGLVFLLPALWFLVRRAIPDGYGWRLLLLFLLGGAQGVVGWWMVKSGLVDRTEVSQFRLAIHLLLALFLMGALIWTALDLLALARDSRTRPARLTALGAIAFVVLGIQLMFGAFTAGLRAGAVANSWPLMQGRFFPEGVEWLAPWWRTFGYDPYLVHFTHRWWAWAALIVLIVLARAVKKRGNRPASIALNSAVGLQVLIGIATVESNIALPFAALHQAVGALVVAATVWCAHSLGQSVAGGNRRLA